MRALCLTVAALLAFAANSVLCRSALGPDAIDPYSFTGIRIASGALVLVAIVALRGGARPRTRVGLPATGWLVLYALPFSLAYVRLDTGTGALLLFGAVQVTMVALGLRRGERPGWLSWAGLAGATAGMVYLVLPGLTAPDPLGAALMVAAGVGWGCYSVAGKGVEDPARVTATHFARAALLLVPVALVAWPLGGAHASVRGVGLAVASGVVASGLGYVIWYAALRYLTATRAALVELSVPVLAAAGGVVLIGEELTARLVLSGAVILGSVALGTVRKRPR